MGLNGFDFPDTTWKNQLINQTFFRVAFLKDLAPNLIKLQNAVFTVKKTATDQQADME